MYVRVLNMEIAIFAAFNTFLTYWPELVHVLHPSTYIGPSTTPVIVDHQYCGTVQELTECNMFNLDIQISTFLNIQAILI